MNIKISDKIKYIGVDDTTLDLFESQYIIPEGVSYNSYVILDDKVAVIDTVDERKQKEWEEKLYTTLDGRTVDYLIIQHLEPDHAGGILRVLELYPEVTLVGNQKTFLFLSQFLSPYDVVVDELKKQVVKENDTLHLGQHTLHFFMATMVHWPEVFVTYEATEQVLFSADAFGKFGALESTEDLTRELENRNGTEEDDWACEARRYYFNIVGKYGIAVQALLAKVNTLSVQKICPAHGPILGGYDCQSGGSKNGESLEKYLKLYDTWSRYEPETRGVLIAYGSFHGNSKKAAEYVAQLLQEKGEAHVVLRDMAREDMAEVIEDAFRYDRMLLVAASHDAGVFPQMKDFLHRLQSKGFQKRKVGIIENGTWSPSAGRTMREILDAMKNIDIVEPVVTIYSVMKESDKEAIQELVNQMICRYSLGRK